VGKTPSAGVAPSDGCGQPSDAAMDGANQTAAYDALIDDFEHKDGAIYPRGGRHGAWITFNDGTGMQTPASGMPLVPELWAGDAGSGSHALHTSGTSFTTWGAAVQVSLSSMPYDAQGYSGIRFTYASTTPLIFGVGTVATTPPPQGSCASDCYGHFGVRLPASARLTTVEASWDELYQSFGAPAVFDPTQLLALQWNFPVGSPFDFWLDDVAFVPACSSDGGPINTRPPPPPLLIDNFDDLDALPYDPRFTKWTHYTYNTSASALDHRPGSELGVYSWVDRNGNGSVGDMELEWNLQDVPDGAPDYAGGGLFTPAKGYIDLSRYTKLVLSHRYEHTGNCESITEFSVAIGCDHYHTSFETQIHVASAWKEEELSFSTFHEQTNAPVTGIPMEQCLGFASLLNFSFQSPRADGACATGHLFLDGISVW
jgi:hypothetical protein